MIADEGAEGVTPAPEGRRVSRCPREAGVTAHLSWFAAYAMALDAFDLALDSNFGDAERALVRRFSPLNASEMTRVAVAMAMLGRAGFLDSHRHEELELMKLQLAWIWTPEMER